MTKQQFLDGKEFTLGTSHFKLDGKRTMIVKVYRRSDGTKLFEDFTCTLSRVRDNSFEAFTYVMDTEVNIKYFFKDLTLYTPVEDTVEEVRDACGEDPTNCSGC